MITTNTSGGALSAAFQTRIAQSFLDPTLAPQDQILFCRRPAATWYTRDVTALWLGMSDIDKSMAQQIGVSEGMEVDFTFSNAPLYTLDTNYTSGTTLSVYANQEDLYWDVQADDWIAISDYDHTEYRRVASYSAGSITITEALDYTYTADDAQIRFVYAIEPSKDRLDPDDFYQGWILVKSGFEIAAALEYIYTFQGKVTRGHITPQQTITLTCRDRVKELVEYELSQRFEVDDRGVATVPMPNPSNDGTGTISDVTYNPRKIPDVLTTELWTATFGLDLSLSVVGGVSGPVDSSDIFISGDTGNRVWTVDARLTYGWMVEISEGDVAFQGGDGFRWWTQASGTVAAVKGGTWAGNRIDTTNLTALYPSHVVEYIIRYQIPMQHENLETGATSTLIPASVLSTVRARAQDYFTELRGWFPARSRAIDIIDDALKPVLGWIFSTSDDHIGIQYYSPFMLNSPTSFNLSHDVDNSARTLNVLAVRAEAMDVEGVRNRVVFDTNTHDETRSYEAVDDDSESVFGRKTLFIRAEDLNEYRLSTRFYVKEGVVRAAANRILRRYKDPVQRFGLQAHPHAQLLELGDTPVLFARDVQFSNQRIWITRIRTNLFTRVIEIEAEKATHLNGKYWKWRDSVAPADPTGSAIWDSTGFIGSEGEGRIFIWSDQTLKLDIMGDNDGSYEPRLGKPDEWGNHVEEAFIWW